MNKQDLTNLSQKTREDGKRLFGVCEFLYNIAIVINFIFFVIGLIASIAVFQLSILISGGIILATISFCFFSYMLAVLSTHVGKMLVHNSFASIGLLEYFIENQNKTEEEALPSNRGRDVYSPDVSPIIKRQDPEYFEGEELLDILASYGYKFVSFDDSKGLWILSAGSSNFEYTIDALRSLVSKLKIESTIPPS